jgi:hypothetical protein
LKKTRRNSFNLAECLSQASLAMSSYNNVTFAENLLQLDGCSNILQQQQILVVKSARKHHANSTLI